METLHCNNCEKELGITECDISYGHTYCNDDCRKAKEAKDQELFMARKLLPHEEFTIIVGDDVVTHITRRGDTITSLVRHTLKDHLLKP